MLRVAGRRVLVIGGGTVAVRRVKALVRAGAAVTVVAPQVESIIAECDVQVERRAYQSTDVTDAALVVIASNDAAANEQAATDARRVGALVNRADLPEEGDVLIPAHDHVGPITVAVSTSGVSAASAAVIRDELLASLDQGWVELLTTIAPFRTEAQRCINDPGKRLAALKQMSHADARSIMEAEGAEALAAYCRRIIEQARNM